MPGKALISRVRKDFIKTITFDSASGSGLVNVDVVVLTITGTVILKEWAIRCTTSLVAAGGTISLGTDADADSIILATSTNDIDANDFWSDQTPEPESEPALVNRVIASNLLIEPLTTTVSAGVLVFMGFWFPLSADGNIA